MADKAVPFFNPTDIPGIGGDWIVQTDGIQHTQQRAQGLKADGDESTFKGYDGKSAGNVVLECHLVSGTLSVPSVGTVGGSYFIEAAEVKYNPVGWPRLTVTVHQHDENPHSADLNEFASSVTLPAGFGIPRAITTGGGAITLADDDAGVNDLTYTLRCTHVDELDGAGNHLAGQSRDGVETLAYGFTKEPSSVTNTDATWLEMGAGPTHANTEAEKATKAWEHHVVRTVVP